MDKIFDKFTCNSCLNLKAKVFIVDGTVTDLYHLTDMHDVT